MLRQIKVTELCKELEEKLVGLQYSEDSLRRYRKVFREFEEYAGDCDYSQSRGTDFLLWKFKQLGGFVTSGEHSKNEMYYFRVIRSEERRVGKECRIICTSADCHWEYDRNVVCQHRQHKGN